MFKSFKRQNTMRGRDGALGEPRCGFLVGWLRHVTLSYLKELQVQYRVKWQSEKLGIRKSDTQDRVNAPNWRTGKLNP